MFNKLFLAFILFAAAMPAQGQEHFKATPILRTSETISGQPINYLRTNLAEVTSVLVEIQPGGESGRHKHPAPPQIYVLEGTVTIEFDDGQRKSFSSGQAFVEVANTWHNAKNLGKQPVKMLVVFFGEKGQENLIRP